MFFFKFPEASQAFMALAGKALRGALAPGEQIQFDQLLKQHPKFKGQFAELVAEVEQSKFNEMWERGLRVLLRCPQPEDRAFLESVKRSDPKAWNDFRRGAFVLRVMAESVANPSKPSFSNALAPDEEMDLLAAVKAEQQKRKERTHRLRGN